VSRYDHSDIDSARYVYFLGLASDAELRELPSSCLCVVEGDLHANLVALEIHRPSSEWIIFDAWASLPPAGRRAWEEPDLA
jgi:hypothetical protein